ncbi:MULTISPECIES: 4-hydroxy-tetrahydrodipicolinate reductase [Halolamina]|uniref:4-hydroxy-tetrahydrodipicolinate reductase n=1 Tax=Halolamina pelagica TaxID=699431 RepID=A0A1I5NJ73_9EURY|nr:MULTISPECIES: 4-hydroxy-tetrahydrodipicolinate reductase [Halolamina]NHX36344.1 4-hydroxy-tetrahydrodipicolinate reductase [Halolamina sp. R1-12]SFP21875.1 dihydrodipicolinate reductase [Halolamina pelagica]
MTGEPTRIVVTGASGRMGEELIDAAGDRSDVLIVAAVSRTPGSVTAEAAVGTHLDATLADEDHVDAVVDFTAPEATAEYAAIAAEHGVAFVTGTTGLAGHEADPVTALDAASESVPVLHASNFSRGIATLRGAIREAAASLPGYDVEVTETHHDGKRDAPSGTALTLAEDIEAERSDLTERQHGREGEQPREPEEIGVHARRAGDVTGEHEVLFAGNRETVSLSHRAGDRGVFAEGALDAAVAVADREPGRYEFADLLRD